MTTRIVLTSGYNRALHVIVLAELLWRDGLEVSGILVVTPYQIKRFRQMVRQRGWGFVKAAVRKLSGSRLPAGVGEGESPLAQYARSEAIHYTSLRKWARDHCVPFRSVNSLNDENSLRFLRGTNASGVIYGGGGILKPEFLAAINGPVLNAHSGPLPAIRGMNACEWSLLRGLAPCVTIHAIDSGIDTGPILEEVPVSRQQGDSVDRLRDKCVLLGVQRLRHHAKKLGSIPPAQSVVPLVERQCFVLAPALRDILDQRLASGAHDFSPGAPSPKATTPC